MLTFLSFLGIVAWAYSARRKAPFDQAANAPFALPDEAERRTLSGQDRGAALMSDFTSGFWSWFVIVVTFGSIGYCAWLLVGHEPHARQVRRLRPRPRAPAKWS